MKRILRRALPALLAVILCTAASAAEQKIATANLKKIFDGYWKTKQAQANVNEKAMDFDKRLNEMIEDFKKVEATYKQLLESAGDPAVSAEEKAKRNKGADAKMRELEEIRQSVQQFERGARAQMIELKRNYTDKVVAEIRAVIETKARNVGYSFVLDSSSDSIGGTPVIVFTDGKNDLTDEVLTQLELSRPVGFVDPKLDTKPDPKRDSKDGKDGKK